MIFASYHKGSGTPAKIRRRAKTFAASIQSLSVDNDSAKYKDHWSALVYFSVVHLQLLSCQPRVTVTCFVCKVIRDLESIDHLCINPIRMTSKCFT